MKASGNGEPMQCVGNLLRIVRGECPYDRIKGMDPTLIDQPTEIAAPLMQAEAKWLIKTYEPRVNADAVDVSAISAQEGSFALNVDTTVTGQEVTNG